MDHVRLILAIVLSTLVFIVWHVFFGGSVLVGKAPQKAENRPVQQEEPKPSIAKRVRLERAETAQNGVS